MKIGDKVRLKKSVMTTFATWRRLQQMMKISKRIRNKMTGIIQHDDNNVVTVLFPDWGNKQEKFLKCDLEIIDENKQK